MREQLTYRLFEDGDLPGLLRLWEEAGWGTLAPEQWREWFVNGPQGPSLVTVGVDGRGEVAAQEMFAPSRAVVGGREVRALRFSAPIVSEEARRSLRTLAPRRAYKAAVVEGARGFSSSLPGARVAPPSSAAPELDTAFRQEPTVRAAVEAGAGPGDARGQGLERAASRSRRRDDQLWREARESFSIDCGVLRDPAGSVSQSGRIGVELRERAGAGSSVIATKNRRTVSRPAVARALRVGGFLAARSVARAEPTPMPAA